MPTWSFIKAVLQSKALKLSLLLLLSPLIFQAQTLTGLWTGALHNDSNTIRKDQSFEIALTEYNGKVYGYSRSEFIVDDTLYYILKRVKGTIEGDVCEVKDDEIISYNFRGKLDKGIKVTSTFRRNQNDSTWYLDGTWKTNATKKYYAVSGKVNLANEKDLSVSKIFPHLEELKLADEVAFYAERPSAAPVVKVAKPEKLSVSYTVNKETLSSTSSTIAVSAQPAAPLISEPVIQSIGAVKKPEDDLAKTPVQEIAVTPTSLSPVSTTSLSAQQPAKKPIAEVAGTQSVTEKSLVATDTPAPVVKTAIAKSADDKPVSAEKNNNHPIVNNASENVTSNKTAATQSSVVKTNTGPPASKTAGATVSKSASITSPVNQPPVTKTNTVQPSTVSGNLPVSNPVVGAATKQATATSPSNTTSVAAGKKPETVNPPDKENSVVVAPVIQEVKTPKPDITEKAAVIAGRKSEFSQIVNFKSDSLIISLYDNGEIDGDTVSVFLNGETILSKQGLKSSAIKKTIYVNRSGDEDFTLVMFAESLGKYPPNTGLLVIRDGDDIYNLRFSSDFQKNAGIIFRKKK
jgi:hypothetical protein